MNVTDECYLYWWQFTFGLRLSLVWSVVWHRSCCSGYRRGRRCGCNRTLQPNIIIKINICLHRPIVGQMLPPNLAPYTILCHQLPVTLKGVYLVPPSSAWSIATLPRCRRAPQFGYFVPTARQACGWRGPPIYAAFSPTSVILVLERSVEFRMRSNIITLILIHESRPSLGQLNRPLHLTTLTIL